MSTPKPIDSLMRQISIMRMHFRAFSIHAMKVLRLLWRILGSITVVTSVACLVGLVTYVGFNHDIADIRLLRGLLRIAQGIFVVNVTFNLLFRRAIHGKSRPLPVVGWIVQLLVLVTLLPWVYPIPAHPWIPLLRTILYSNWFLYAVMAGYSLFEIGLCFMALIGRRTNPSLILAGSFLFFIILGAFLLMLPKCTVNGISFVDSIFVSSSAVCITGLTPVDVSQTFSPLGMLVLALLIQIGGLGVLTFTCFFAMFFSGSSSIYNQLLLRDLVYSRTMGALMPTMLYILSFTLVIELIGAVGIYVTLPNDLELTQTEKIHTSLFLSLSSFCNAGFSPIPGGLSNPALLNSNQSIYIVTSILIFAGAVGFPLLVNARELLCARVRQLFNKAMKTRRTSPRRIHISDLNTKVVLTTTLIILGVSTVSFFILEYDNTLRGMSLYEKAVQSLFNSLAPRSAGFASVSPAAFLPATLLIVMVQMVIGGASQSMAGGIKVNTVAVSFLSLRAALRGHSHPSAWNRSIPGASVRRAGAVIFLAIVTFVVYSVTILQLEPEMAARDVIFEVISAIFTVGSSLGITTDLCDASKIVLCTAMFIGRVGIISILCGIIRPTPDLSAHLLEENIIIN